MTQIERIPVVDIFAGPGGLGEGFASFPYTKPNESRFRSQLAVEFDPPGKNKKPKLQEAFKTLRLRSFTRQFPANRLPRDYYRLLKDVSRPWEERVNALFNAFPQESEIAHSEVLNAQLGNPEFATTIKSALSKAVGKTKHWVLLGGPPCQAYSLVGRSRNRGIEDYRPEKDHRHFLYREYLKVIGEHLPSVFVMENVKGLLSATVENKGIFEQIITDLRDPRKSLEITKRKPRGLKSTYRLFAIGANESGEKQGALFDEADQSAMTDFVIRMEQFGVPQARHRLIIIGIRDDLGINELPELLRPQDPVHAIDVLGDLPRLRSGLSREVDCDELWKQRVAEATDSPWFKSLNNGSANVRKLIKTTIRDLKQSEVDRGSEWVKCNLKPGYLKRWYHDRNIAGVFNHETRQHITADLHRYLFASCYAQTNGTSPSLKDFPKGLLPKHRNVKRALNGSLFADRFRVQVSERPSSTITSHISKDGHYYIHPDPAQCRSLTVREAARLQTFPDNYFFCGPRTSQYVQVGNAVPPYLAHQIAKIVFRVFVETGLV